MATILVVDDEVLLRRTLRVHLEQEGYALIEAGDGEAGLKAIAAGDVDLVLIDVLMPGMDGIETIMELRRRKSQLPIIAMSGGGRMPAKNLLGPAGKLGADLTIAKPFSMKDLVREIARLLG